MVHEFFFHGNLILYYTVCRFIFFPQFKNLLYKENRNNDSVYILRQFDIVVNIVLSLINSK